MHRHRAYTPRAQPVDSVFRQCELQHRRHFDLNRRPKYTHDVCIHRHRNRRVFANFQTASWAPL